MKVIAEVSIVPINGGAQMRDEVAYAHTLLRQTGCPVELHAKGTNIEGEFDTVMAAVRRVHETLHAEGVVRVFTDLRIDSRTDKEDSLRRRVESMGRAAFA